MRLKGKSAVVTGAASGFGRATAIRFAEEGANVVIVDLDAPRAEESAALAKKAGAQAEFVVADVSNSAGASSGVERCLERFGRIDVLVNNAGVSNPMLKDTWNAEEEVWDRTLRINLKSVYLCSRVAIPAMIRQGGGSIVNTASIAASSPVGGAPYAASKGGMLSWTMLVARELAKRNVRVNCVSPGYMRSPMTTGEHKGVPLADQDARMAEFGKLVPMGRVGAVTDIANAILWLASDEANYVTGQEIVVDGGFLVR